MTAGLDSAAEGGMPDGIASAFRAMLPLLLAAAAAVVMSVAVVPSLDLVHLNQISDCGIAVVLAVSLTAVNGFTGQFSIGHSGFMALGGYVAGGLVYYLSWRWFGDADPHGGRLSWIGIGPTGPLASWGDVLFLGTLLVGAVIAAAVGWLVGLPSIRLRGDYLAIVTLGFCEIVRILIQGTPGQLSELTTPAVNTIPLHDEMLHLGGSLNLSNIPAYASASWIVAAAVLTILVTLRLKYSAYGRSLLSIREDEIAARACGVDVTKRKVRAFVFAAFFAGIGGGLYAMKNPGSIDAKDLGFQKSFEIIIMVVLGGLGSVSGAVLAAILLTLLPQWLMGFASYRMVIYALLLIVMMIVRPQGLFGVREIWEYLPRRRRVP
jgi:branched-chain amino acid transport system permease protein